MKVGDRATFAGDYEPERWWVRVKRRLGFNLPPRRLRMYVITEIVGGPCVTVDALEPVIQR